MFIIHCFLNDLHWQGWFQIFRERSLQIRNTRFLFFGGIVILFLFCTDISYRNAYSLENPQEQDLRLKSEYPFVYYNISTWLPERTIIGEGMIISKTLESSLVNFRPWPLELEDNPDNLKITKTNLSDSTFYRLSGNTLSESDGLISDVNDYKGRYISFIIGKTIKNSDFQVSFSLLVEGQKENYNIVLIHGPLKVEGWIGNTYYEKINSYSSRLLDLEKLLESQDDEYVSTDQIVTVITRNSSLPVFDFIVALGKLTENTPVAVEGGNKYFVNGTAVDYDYSAKESEYLFHDLSLWEKVTLNFTDVPTSSRISSNNWHIVDIKNLNDDLGAQERDIIVKADSTRGISLSSTESAMLMKLDLIGSITNLAAKDYLLVVVCVVLFCSIIPIRINLRL